MTLPLLTGRLASWGRNSLLIGVLAWGSQDLGLAQTATPLPPSLLNRDLIPKSPTAAGLGRFGDVPVGLYTGVPSIEIPLYTLQGRSVAVPVKLQYHGGGVKLDDLASWVGMGWSLNAGGVINHSIRGTDDLAPGGYLLASNPLGTPSVPYTIPANCGASREAGTPDYFSYVQSIYGGQLDSQPDIFSFNFLNYSGRVLFNQQGECFLSPSQPLRVEPPTATRKQWKFTDEQGTQYIFRLADAEYTNGFPVSAPTSYTPSAWYLSAVRALSGDSATFFYKNYSSTIEYQAKQGGQIGETQILLDTWDNQDGGDHSPSSRCAPCERLLVGGYKNGQQIIAGKLLRRIVAGESQVDFFSSTSRQDYASQYQLDSLQLTSLVEQGPRQIFRLGYGTYGAERRLLLQTAQARGRGTDGRWVASPAYQFAYDRSAEQQQGYTAPGSLATDRWGFFNGATTRATGFVSFPGDNHLGPLPGADRETNPDYVGFGLLQRIIYPTGGTSEFTFEPHDFGNIDPTENHREHWAPLAVCTALADPNPGVGYGLPNCGNAPPVQDFTVDHEEPITFTCTLFEPYSAPPPAPTGPGIPHEAEQDIVVHVWAERTEGGTVEVPFLNNAQTSREATARFPAGHYRLYVTLSQQPDRYVQAQVRGEYLQYLPNAVYSRQGGGTRIKRIQTFDGLDHQRDMVKEFYYTDSMGTASSGRLLHQPVFNQWIRNYNRNRVGMPGEGEDCVPPKGGLYLCQYLMRSTQDLMAATGTVSGSEVGYSRVTVVERSQGTAHKTVSTFRNTAPEQVLLTQNLIYNQGTVASLNNATNGLLLHTEAYAVTPETDPLRWAGCRLVKRSVNQYAALRQRTLLGLSLGGGLGNFQYDDFADNLGRGISCQGVFAYSYRTYVGWYPLVQLHETLFDTQGRALTTLTQTEYDTVSHLQPIRRLVTVNGREKQLTRYKYPVDYAPGVGNTTALLAAHFIGQPLEEQQWRITATDSLWLSGRVTRYARLAGGAIVPAQIQLTRLAAPSTALPPPRAREPRFTTLLPSPAYEPRATFSYKPTGQLIDQHLVGDVPSSLLWANADRHPLAEAKRAGYNQLAVTSFEPDATGRWRYDSTGTGHRVLGGRTGRWAYQLDGTPAGKITRDNLPAGEYEVTYWAQVPPGGALPTLAVTQGSLTSSNQLLTRGPAQWGQYRSRLHLAAPGSVMLTGPAGLLDELRLCPVGAQLTSYTYDAFGNVTSQTDPAGRTATYEYDGLGRLVRTRDEQGRILSQQQYHYAGR